MPTLGLSLEAIPASDGDLTQPPEILMNKVLMMTALVTLAARSMAADYAYADDSAANRNPPAVSSDRATVEAELARATASGDLIGLHGAPFKRMAPHLYPAAPVVAGKSRAEVQAELAVAIRTGDMFAANESGLKLNQLSPTAFAAAPVQVPVEVMAGDAIDTSIQQQTGG